MTFSGLVERLGERFLELYVRHVSEFVVYGSLALVAAALTTVAFFAIVGTYHRTTSPLVPATKAVAAALSILAPLALTIAGLLVLAERHYIYLFTFFSPGLILASLCGTPLLLWFPAVALTAQPDFRNEHMPAPPGQAAEAADVPAQAGQVAGPSTHVQEAQGSADKAGPYPAGEPAAPGLAEAKKER